ncbi:hypothetical protein FACS1894151_05000 [Spirochaetia bacterium]|nr:hypothetical protein FACS1894151_05000 [Spirochaetia bacterium]
MSGKDKTKVKTRVRTKVKTRVRTKIRTKVLRVILTTSLGALILLSITSIVSIFNMRGTIMVESARLGSTAARDSESALEAQVRLQLQSLAEDKAALTDEKLTVIQNQTRMIAEVATNIYTNRSQYRPRPIDYLLPDQAGTVPHVSTAPGVPFNRIRDEAYMLANISDILRQMTVIDIGLTAAYIGLEAGFSIIVEEGSYPYENDYDATIRGWYKGAKEKEDLYWTDIFADAAGRGAGISCAMPFYDLSNGQRVFQGVAGCGSILSDNMNKILDSARIGETGYAFLLNERGQVIFTPHADDIITDESGYIVGEDYLHSPKAGLRELAEKMLSRESGVMQLSIDGESMYVAYHPLDAIDWSLGVIVPVSEIIAPALNIKNAIMTLADNAAARIDRNIIMSILVVAAVIVLALFVIFPVAAGLSNSLTAPIVALSASAKIIGAGELNHRLEVKTGDEIEVLAETFNQMIGNIKEITGEKERIGTELNVATRIQASMLPRIFPAFPELEEFELYARMLPAKEVGGDFYDFFFTARDKLTLVIADVSGKGVPAALFMVIAKTLIKNQSQMQKPLDEILFSVNNQLCENNDENMFVTVFVCQLDLITGFLSFANAGHNKPLISRSGGGYEFLELKRGLPLGVSADFPYQSAELTLNEGDKLYLYTDGINEAENLQGEQFGNDRLLETANSCRELAPQDFDEALRRALAGFVNGAEQSDDITSLALFFRQKVKPV